MSRAFILRLLLPALFTLSCGIAALFLIGDLRADQWGAAAKEGSSAIVGIAASFGCACVGPLWIASGAYYLFSERAQQASGNPSATP